MSKFDLKDKIDNLIYKTYNVYSELKFSFDYINKKTLSNNRHFILDNNNNARCFIIGTGPSIKKLSDGVIEQLAHETTFGVNFLYKTKGFHKIKPKYYVLMDDLFWGEYSYVFRDILSHYEEQAPIFVTDIRAKEILSEYKVKNKIYLYAKKYPVDKVNIDYEKNASALNNVVSYAIAVAIYLGYKEIYLLGCDYNAFCTNGIGHCYDDSELKEKKINLAYFLKFYHLTTEFHYLLAKRAKDLDVRIINITEGSLLDAYPRQSVESVL